MSEGRGRAGIDLGIYGRRNGGARARPALIAAGALSAAWLVLAGGVLLAAGRPDGGSGLLVPLLALVALVLPVAMIWVATLALHTARLCREETARLEAAIDALRHAYVTQSQTAGMAVRPAERRGDATAAAPRNPESALAPILARREPGPERRPVLSTRLPDVVAPAPSEAQASLALGTPGESPREPLTTEEYIRALNFPDDENDREGFRALRRALEDREVARLVRASQDVLTLLSQDGIYMDDLKPDRARPEVWRRFAAGERGRSIAALGGVRDRSSLALTAARMRQDEVFRDAAHHFLRHFDRSFSAFAAGATDQEIADLAETRTARAFMLLGRVAGTFD
jgi:hypothetical protein